MRPFSFSSYPAFRLSAIVVAGILIGKWIVLPLSTLSTLTGFLFLLVLALYVAIRRSPDLQVFLTLSVVALSLSVGATKFAFDAQRSFSGAEGFEKRVVVVGTIKDIPVTRGQQTRFVMDADHLIDGSTRSRFPYSVLVTIHRTRRDTNERQFRYGNILALDGILSRPSEERNPGEFSLRQYYEANGISMLLFVKGVPPVVVADSAGGWWLIHDGILPVRGFIVDLIDVTLHGEEKELLKGLLLGERSGISGRTRQAFTNSGVAHVLAVSGSNVAFVAAFLFFLLEFLRLPKWVRMIMTCIGLLFYMLITGSNPPVVRATIMAFVFLLGGLAQEKTNAYNSLGLAALIILMLDARQLFDVGFQLSFVAVLSIMYMYPKANAWIGRIGSARIWHRTLVWVLRVCAVSLAASLGTLPLTAVYFGQVSIIGVLANIVVIPAVGLSLVLGFISVLAGLFSFWFAEAYAALNQMLLQGTLSVITFAGGLRFAFVDTLRFSAIDALPFYVGLAILVHLGNQQVMRRLIIPLLAALNIAVFFPPSPLQASPKDKLRISVIDVGQGDAILVEFPGDKTMLIDAGPTTLNYDAGERIVVPFLKRRGISSLDYLVVSHPHSDHIGGAPATLEHFDVKRVIDSGQPVRSQIYSRYLADIKEEECEVLTAAAGTTMSGVENARVYVLSPVAHYIDTDTSHQHPNLNNTSVVLKLQYGNISVLFSGDAEKEVERDMVSVYGDFLHSTLLKVGHHGSNTSSSEDFLSAVNPTYTVISVGKNNKFHHPSPTVVQRFEEMNAVVYRTDEEGAVIFETDGITLSRVDWK